MSSTQTHNELATPSFSPPPSVLIVAAPYYRDIADDLLAGARGVLEAAGARIEVIEVPGALEVPTAISLARKHFEGFVALGCVIRGETTHYDTVCNDSSRALSLLGLEKVCIGNGILTCETRQQAEVRAAPDHMNKGGGAAAAALHLMALARRFRPDGGGVQPSIPGDDGILLASPSGLTRTA